LTTVTNRDISTTRGRSIRLAQASSIIKNSNNFATSWQKVVIPRAFTNSERWLSSTSRRDEQLIRILLDGEQGALTVLFDRYHRLVYSIDLRIDRDPGEVKEVRMMLLQ
jgi:hypothetical protein